MYRFLAGCIAPYQFAFNKVPSSSGTEVASANGNLAACKAACDKVPTTDCKAFALKGGTMCNLYTSAEPLTDETGTTTFVRGECDGMFTLYSRVNNTSRTRLITT